FETPEPKIPEFDSDPSALLPMNEPPRIAAVGFFDASPRPSSAAPPRYGAIEASAPPPPAPKPPPPPIPSGPPNAWDEKGLRLEKKFPVPAPSGPVPGRPRAPYTLTMSAWTFIVCDATPTCPAWTPTVPAVLPPIPSDPGHHPAVP